MWATVSGGDGSERVAVLRGWEIAGGKAGRGRCSPGSRGPCLAPAASHCAGLSRELLRRPYCCWLLSDMVQLLGGSSEWVGPEQVLCQFGGSLCRGCGAAGEGAGSMCRVRSAVSESFLLSSEVMYRRGWDFKACRMNFFYIAIFNLF